MGSTDKPPPLLGSGYQSCLFLFLFFHSHWIFWARLIVFNNAYHSTFMKLKEIKVIFSHPVTHLEMFCSIQALQSALKEMGSARRP